MCFHDNGCHWCVKNPPHGSVIPYIFLTHCCVTSFPSLLTRLCIFYTEQFFGWMLANRQRVTQQNELTGTRVPSGSWAFAKFSSCLLPSVSLWACSCWSIHVLASSVHQPRCSPVVNHIGFYILFLCLCVYVVFDTFSVRHFAWFANPETCLVVV